jgi:hypothetical protein
LRRLAALESVVEGFAFNDYCIQCDKIAEHRISLQGKEFLGVCSSCGQKRLMTNISETYYPQSDLWVTRFRIGNVPGVVAGKVSDAAKRAKRGL